MAIDQKKLEEIRAKLSRVDCVHRDHGLTRDNVSLHQARKGNILFSVHGGDVEVIDNRKRSTVDLLGSWDGANDADRKLYCDLVGLDFATFRKARELNRKKEAEEERARDAATMRRLAAKLGYAVSLIKAKTP